LSDPVERSIPVRSSSQTDIENVLRLISLAVFFAVWQLAAGLAGPHYLPGPLNVLSRLGVEARSGALFFHLGVTLLRVAVSFTLALSIGAALGFAMGRDRLTDKLGDPWLVLLLNLPALVIIVLAYVWIGLNEVAAIGAVALNKLPNTVATIREGTRALDPRLDEMAEVFCFPFGRRLRHVVAPQLAPYFAAAVRTGLSLIWKIVLIVELLGRSNGVGFQINVAFQLFDMTLLLAYALPFVAIVLLIETFLVRPFEQHVSRWRSSPA
jgi:NitT/TauT family transport system permease protein